MISWTHLETFRHIVSGQCHTTMLYHYSVTTMLHMPCYHVIPCCIYVMLNVTDTITLPSISTLSITTLLPPLPFLPISPLPSLPSLCSSTSKLHWSWLWYGMLNQWSVCVSNCVRVSPCLFVCLFVCVFLSFRVCFYVSACVYLSLWHRCGMHQL